MLYLNYFWITFRDTLKPLLIWSVTWIVLSAYMAYLFDAFDPEGIELFLQSFDQQILDTFGISSGYFSDIHVFLTGEFGAFLHLAGGMYAVSRGVNIVGSLINKKLISYHLGLGFSRTLMLLIRSLAEIIHLAISQFLVGVGTFVMFDYISTSTEPEVWPFVSLFYTTWVLQLVFLSFGLLLSVLLTQKATTYGLVTAGVLWFLKSLSAYDAYPEWLEPVTIYWFVPLEAIGQGEAVDLWRFAWLLTIAIVLYILAIIRFRTQDITV